LSMDVCPAPIHCTWLTMFLVSLGLPGLPVRGVATGRKTLTLFFGAVGLGLELLAHVSWKRRKKDIDDTKVAPELATYFSAFISVVCGRPMLSYAFNSTQMVIAQLKTPFVIVTKQNLCTGYASVCF
jgi:hypothetical protein